MSKKQPDCARVCATCPWLIQNHGLTKPVGWYSTSALRKLWTGLRTAEAPGMICHSTDPNSHHYGGKAGIKPGNEQECAGALTLVISNVNAFAEDRRQPFQPGLTRQAIAYYVERYLFGSVGLSRKLPGVVGRLDDIALPWVSNFLMRKADLESRIAIHDYYLHYVEFCEDARTPGLAGQMRGVIDHECQEVKIGKKANRSEAAIINILEHEVRHLEEPDWDWDCGCRDVIGRGAH